LSTSGSKWQPTFRALALTLCITLILVICADTLFGFVVRNFPAASPNILSGQDAKGLVKFWQLSDAGTTPLVFTGSSLMKAAVVPTQFDENVKSLSGESIASVNIGILAGNVEISRDIVQGILLPKGVHTIVYGIEMRALHTNSDIDKAWQLAFAQSPVGDALSQPAPWRRTILLWLLQHSAFVQYRNSILGWLQGNFSQFDNTPIDDWGHAELHGLNKRDFDTIKEQTGAFQIDDSAREALHSLLTSCQQVRCILINMPLNPESYKFISIQDEMLYRDFLYAAASEAKVPIWDLTTEACRVYLGDKEFNDVNHLNTDGAAKFTSVVAELYVQQVLGKSTPISTDCVKVSTS
jgi:hypothetical protein